MKNSQGEGTKKRLAQRSLNFIDGTTSSRCGIINCNECIELMRRANEVSGVMADQRMKDFRKRKITG